MQNIAPKGHVNVYSFFFCQTFSLHNSYIIIRTIRFAWISFVLFFFILINYELEHITWNTIKNATYTRRRTYTYVMYIFENLWKIIIHICLMFFDVLSLYFIFWDLRLCVNWIIYKVKVYTRKIVVKRSKLIGKIYTQNMRR